MQDLRSGNISRQLIHLTAPLIMGNILQQFYNTIDALVIGRYAGQNEFAAVGIAGAVMNLFLFAIAGACAGISVLFAQQYGSRDIPLFRREHFLTLTAGVPAAAAGSVIGLFLVPAILQLIRTPESLYSYAESYLLIILAGLPATFLYNLYSAMLRSVGNTRAALFILAAAMGTNLVLDVWFVAELGLGIAGAAVATVISQILSALLCMGYLRQKFPELLFRRPDCRMDTGLLQRTAHFALVAGLQQSGLYLGKLLVQGAVNTGGTELISAYTAATRIEGFANSFGDSGAAATSILVAQNFGARFTGRVKECFRKSLQLLSIMGVICSAVLFVTAPRTATFMLGSSSGAAFENAVIYLHTVALFYLLCFTGNTFAGYFDGCGKVSIPMAGAIGHITFRAVFSWLFIGRLGLNAVALSTGTGWILVNLFWTILYAKQTAGRKRRNPTAENSRTPFTGQSESSVR